MPIGNDKIYRIPVNRPSYSTGNAPGKPTHQLPRGNLTAIAAAGARQGANAIPRVQPQAPAYRTKGRTLEQLTSDLQHARQNLTLHQGISPGWQERINNIGAAIQNRRNGIPAIPKATTQATTTPAGGQAAKTQTSTFDATKLTPEQLAAERRKAQLGLDRHGGNAPGWSDRIAAIDKQLAALGNTTPSGFDASKLSDEDLAAQLQRADAGLARHHGNAAGWSERENLIKAEQAKRAAAQPQQPQAPAQTQPASTTPAASTPAPSGGADPSTFFPSIRAFEPSNYEGSPLYKFQLDQGQKALDRLYASRGLTNSGAEIQGNTDFVTQLGAQEANRAQGVAETEADRLYRMQEDEALRRERAGNDQFSHLYDIARLYLDQNPMQYAYKGTEAAGDTTTNKGQFDSKITSGLYDRPSVGVAGGGGGGSSAPPYLPPTATTPDYSQFDISRVLTGAANTNDWLSVLSKALGAFGTNGGQAKAA